MPKSQIISASITDGGITNTDIADSTLTTTKLATPNLGRRNLVLNSKFSIAQRGTSFSGFSTSQYHLDRFRNGMGDTTARFTVTQASSGLNGFPHCLKYDCTTAESSLNNGNARMFLHTRFEGQDLQHIKKGTSDAEKVTVSFYVKSNKTGTYILELEDKDNTRQISKAYTINSANTWEQKIITFDADTTGAFDNDNNNSCHLTWHLIAGTNYQSGTLNTSWASQTHANRAVGNVNIGDSTDNTWEITGIQMEVSEQATPFEHRSFGEELSLCKRYFQSYTDNGSGGGYVTNGTIVVQRFYGTFRYQKQMRAIPSITSTSGGFNVQSSAASVGSQSIDETHNPTIDSVRFRTGSNVNNSNGQGALLRFDTGTIEIDAEL
tara:strand:- start:109 stop:1245 length:1137 start_codon:yes stop_codon:yes gene_type:complete